MVDLGPDPEKDHPHTLSCAPNSTDRDEALHEDREEKDGFDLPPDKDDLRSIRSISESLQGEEKRTALEQAQTAATTASAVTGTESRIELKKKLWYKNLNPLRWGKIPPVPEVRKVSREYNAPFLSLVYFQWIAPIMSVSTSAPTLRVTYLKYPVRHANMV
jgi:ATP-binding cassette, subfamily C (CFTR/MRP), member 1